MLRSFKMWLTGQIVDRCKTVVVFLPVVEEDEDDFLTTTRPDGEYNHNNNGSKEKCKFTCRCFPTIHCFI